MVENSILRRNARAQLGNSIFSGTWLMVLVAFIIFSAISSAAAGIGLGVGAIIVAGPLMYGLYRICVSLVKGKNQIDLSDMFTGFTENFAQSLLVNLMSSIFVTLWTLLFVVPGIVKFYSYSMATYILQDDPNKDWDECINESKQMMKGHKWQAFCLDLSFIGWYLLGACAFGVGVLFVYPYHLTAKANFYLALLASREQPTSTDQHAEAEQF